MTIFISIVDLTGSDLDFSKKNSIKNIMEHDVGEKCTYEFSKNSFYCVGYDSGAYKSSGIYGDEESFTLVVGDPIISHGEIRSRSDDVFTLHGEFEYGIPKSLNDARGMFAGLHFNSHGNECYFFTDKLGNRPVYYYLNAGLLVFSSTLKHLEKLSFIDFDEDFIGICESSTFTYPLGDRTPYKYIKLLRSGEIFSIKNGLVSSKIYWDWSVVNFSINQNGLSELCRQAFDVFNEAVRLRIGDEKNAFAFLSGGLDSRCVTAAVKKHVNILYTFNFSEDQSQDAEFAALYSYYLGSNHHRISVERLSYPNWSHLIANALANIEIREKEYPIYPQKIWSGDGGSVGAGFVYLDNDMIDVLENGSIDTAIEIFLKKNKVGIPFRFISNTSIANPKTLIHDSVSYELAKMDAIPLEKRLYMFLLLNDQRRHLTTHFETIASHKIELMVPFYDSKFLSVILSVPIKKALGHQFYMNWFNLFPGFSRMSPWQTYPGHQKCPLEIPSNLTYQWENNRKWDDCQQAKRDADEIIQLIINVPFLKRYIRSSMVILAMLLHKYRIRSYYHLVVFIKTLSNYIKKYGE